MVWWNSADRRWLLFRSQSEPGSHVARKPSAPDKDPTRYKTELCRSFEEYGDCCYGDRCLFAHGIWDLRAINRHPKYKTKLCRRFHSDGVCPYGRRCNFLHNADEWSLGMAELPPVNLSSPYSSSLGSLSPASSLSLSPWPSPAEHFPWADSSRESFDSDEDSTGRNIVPMNDSECDLDLSALAQLCDQITNKCLGL